jgi:hypothetical protein
MYNIISGQGVYFDYRGALVVPIVAFLLFMFGVRYWISVIKERYMTLIYMGYMLYFYFCFGLWCYSAGHYN